MNCLKNIFSSESVTEGHPDKVCDQISDAILDAYLTEDPYSRVACETMIMPGKVLVGGEITSKANIDISKVVRRVLQEKDYTDEYHGLSAENSKIEINIVPQSEDISRGVDCSYESKNNMSTDTLGAGDQGIMHGYATDEFKNFMPAPIVLAHMLVKKLDTARKSNEIEYLLSDGKAQVSVEYSDDMKPLCCKSIVLSTQHYSDISYEQLCRDLREQIVLPVIPEHLITKETKIFINPTGRFVSGGAKADCGLTGRKIIVDTYGGFGRHGGGAFSGKDASKIDRSGAYMARFIAKNLVASKICKRVDVQLAYAIGVAEPVGIYVDTFGTGKIPDSNIANNVQKQLELTPSAIIEKLGLLEPIYEPLAVYGQVGRSDIELSWEKIEYLYFGV